MPKKQNPEKPADQSERFKREAQKLIDAGELNPTEANERFEALAKSLFNKSSNNE